MLTLALALALTQTPQHRLVKQPNLPRAGFAFFEFAPASGVGMPSACSTTAPTGARGEVVTFTRTGPATCDSTTTGALGTSGIANGALVELSSNIVRVVHAANGEKGIHIEGSATNLALRFIDYANAAWSDIGTPTLTGSQTSPFTGTYASSAVQFDDNDGAAYEGRAQTITVSAGVAYYMFCYVKAGTLAEARITLDGTATTKTGLSSLTWDIIAVADASSSGTSIVMQVMNGDATGDTGTVIWGGCDVKASTYRTSIVPTVGTTITRGADTATATINMSNATGSHAVSFQISSGSDARLLRYDANGIPLYVSNPFQYMRLWDGANNPSVATGAISTTSVHRAWSSYTGSTSVVNYDGTSATAGFDGTMGASAAALSICNGDSTWADGICLRVCADPDPSRCR